MCKFKSLFLISIVFFFTGHASLEMQDPLMDNEAKNLESKKFIIDTIGEAYMKIAQDIASTHVPLTKELEMEKDGVKYIKTHFESLSAYNDDFYVFTKIDVKNFDYAEYKMVVDKKVGSSKYHYSKNPIHGTYDLNLTALFSDLAESELPFSIDVGNYFGNYYHIDSRAKTYMLCQKGVDDIGTSQGGLFNCFCDPKPKPEPKPFSVVNYTIPLSKDVWGEVSVSVNFGAKQKNN